MKNKYVIKIYHVNHSNCRIEEIKYKFKIIDLLVYSVLKKFYNNQIELTYERNTNNV